MDLTTAPEFEGAVGLLFPSESKNIGWPIVPSGSVDNFILPLINKPFLELSPNATNNEPVDADEEAANDILPLLFIW